ncbi:MAG: histidine phosphatase family protein [Balneolaceae bacterium]|nr:histidine phosphatase family protein [Balneolaceae bacterium]MBO6546190.1 histidine phosphatase family protein [Balneolaceae bacterium]MBO6648549.1 histidine phosphatase family protein [Balneolaceae bacterium]
MSRLIVFVLLFLQFSFISCDKSEDEATLIFVRHTERADDGTNDPPISQQGIDRAVNLYHVLRDNGYKISAVYSTDWLRTRMTGQPTADSLNLTIELYDQEDPETFVNSMIQRHKGESALIVGHFDSTPFFINLILGEERITEPTEYGELFIVNTSEIGSAEVEVKLF